jgi:hypothetical protein
VAVDLANSIAATDEDFTPGQHQNGQMNYNGEDVLLAQHNMDVAILFVVSTRNYGLLWDNNSITRFGNPEPYTYAGEREMVWRSMAERLDRDVQRQRQNDGEAAEPTIRVQYLEDANRWPAGTRTPDMQQTVPGLRVSWEWYDCAAKRRPPSLPPLRLELLASCSSTTSGARSLATELEPLVP